MAQAFALVVGVEMFWRSFGDPMYERKVKAVHRDMENGFKTSLEMFRIDYGRYPNSQEGLKALFDPPTDISPENWRGPYLDGVLPEDPWGNEYVYRCPGIHNTDSYDLYSCGFDGISKSGGKDPDDINSWDPASPHDWAVRSLDDYEPFSIGTCVLLLISPLSYEARLIAVRISPRIREVISENPMVDSLWLPLALAVIIVTFVLAIPQLAG